MLLAEVYLELIEARQAQLGLEVAGSRNKLEVVNSAVRVRSVALLPRLTPEDRAAHRAFIDQLGPKAIWLDYLPALSSEDESDPVAARAQAG